MCDRLPRRGVGAETGQRRHSRARWCVAGGEHHHAPEPRQGRAAAPVFPARREIIQEVQVLEVAEPVHGDQQHGVGLLQCITKLVAPVQEVDWHRHRAGTGDGELDGDEFRVVGQQQRDMVAGLHAGAHQSGRDALGPRLDFPV